MKIVIESIPHEQQDYPTVGNWKVSLPDDLTIHVSKMRDTRYMLLVGLHELIEASLCAHHKIREEDVTTFDQLFEHERRVGKVPPNAEPGDDMRAPYWREHQIATAFEKQMAHWLDVDWDQYDKEVNSL